MPGLRYLFLCFVVFSTACIGGYSHVRISDQFDPSRLACIAVAPFDNLSLTSRAGLMISDMVANALVRDAGAAVMEPRSFLYFADRHKMDTKNLSSQDLLRKIREEWGVDVLVRGKVREYWYTDDPEVYADKQPAVAFRFEIVDTETSEVLMDVDISGSRSGLAPGVGSLSTIALKKVDDAVSDLLSTLNKRGQRAYPSCAFNETSFAAPLVASPEPEQKALPVVTPARPLDKVALDLLGRLKGGTRSVLRSLQFEYGNAIFRDSTEETLRALANLMKTYPKLEVSIWVHTDNSLGIDESAELTRRQAQAILNWMRDQGEIHPTRILLHAVGSGEPILPNINRRNRMVNRRIEIQVTRLPEGGW